MLVTFASRRSTVVGSAEGEIDGVAASRRREERLDFVKASSSSTLETIGLCTLPVGKLLGVLVGGVVGCWLGFTVGGRLGCAEEDNRARFLLLPTYQTDGATATGLAPGSVASSETKSVWRLGDLAAEEREGLSGCSFQFSSDARDGLPLGLLDGPLVGTADGCLVGGVVGDELGRTGMGNIEISRDEMPGFRDPRITSILPLGCVVGLWVGPPVGSALGRLLGPVVGRTATRETCQGAPRLCSDPWHLLRFLISPLGTLVGLRLGAPLGATEGDWEGFPGRTRCQAPWWQARDPRRARTCGLTTRLARRFLAWGS
eukprot:scaffold1070_cov245-Pinguiococcus_pyrenoidosus.AAC.8